MTLLRSLRTLLVPLLVIGFTGAATLEANHPACAQQGAVGVPETYRINYEDVLQINAIDIQAFSNIQVAVLSDGTISLPIVGQIRVVGMTLAELEKKVAAGLAKQYVKPSVSASIRERHPRQVSVLGSVKLVGNRSMRDGWRIMDAIGDAGGLPSDRVEFFSGELLRTSTGKVMKLDLKALLQGDPLQNILLEPGDVIKVDQLDEAQTYVQVIGEVLRPGAVVTPRDGSIATVLNTAGGPTKIAALSLAKIERKGQTLPIDLRSVIKDGTVPEGAKVEPGDKLIIPENKKYIRVFGVVGRPGELLYPDDRTLTVSQTIAFAGGVVQGAELKKVRLARAGADGQTTDVVVNVEKMLKTSDYSDDIVVQPGDSLYIPSNPRRGMTPLEVLGILQTLAISMPFLIDRVFKRI